MSDNVHMTEPAYLSRLFAYYNDEFARFAYPIGLDMQDLLYFMTRLGRRTKYVVSAHARVTEHELPLEHVSEE